jgi:hypothetical protein
MKRLFFTAFIAISLSSYAQPVILDGSNTPDPGFSGTLSIATTLDPGPAGADQVWDFSSLTFVPLGAIIVTDPSLTPMAASFPSANFCFSLTGTYSFFRFAPDKMEVQAYTITAAGGPGDYSPNPRTMMTFPFHYLDEFTDTWQLVGESVNTVTTTYDAYGTLITPDATYENVVRIAENYGGGEIDYQWFSLDPLMFLMVYSESENQLYYSGIETAPVAVEQVDQALVSVFPNPADKSICFQLENLFSEQAITLSFYSVAGKHVMNSSLGSSETCVDVSSCTPGIYVYQLSCNGDLYGSGTVVIE